MLWLGVIAAALFALLAVPVDVAFSARRRERLETRLTVGWLWGLVTVPISPGSRNEPRREKKKRRARPKPHTPSGTRRALAVMRSGDFSRRVLRLLWDVLHRIRIRRLDLDLRLGLDDPADTGRLWGVIGPASALLALPASANVAIAPEFSKPLLHLDAHADARVVPAALLAVVVAFLISLPTLRSVGAAIRGTP